MSDEPRYCYYCDDYLITDDERYEGFHKACSKKAEQDFQKNPDKPSFWNRLVRLIYGGVE